MKMKKSYTILVSPTDFLKKFLLLPNFLKTLSFPLKKEGEGLMKTNVFSSKNLCNIMQFFLCVLVGTYWCFLHVFSAASHKK